MLAPDPNLYIEELSKFLAINAFSHSADDPLHAGKYPIFLQKETDKKYARSRNILIIRAGVSFNANDHIPLAGKFAADLMGVFNKLFDKNDLKKNR